MAKRYDAIVLGIGGMGSATTYHLAKRGLKVLGIEQFDIPHLRGSSHGITRVIRLAYFEDPSYVPLLVRAFELWRELERAAKVPLLHITGSIDAGPADGEIVNGSRRSCELHGLRHEILTSAELTRRFPGYNLPSKNMAVLQPDGGFLAPEKCIVAHTALAKSLGAEVHTGERSAAWEPTEGGIRLTTDQGVYEADRLVISAGAWVSKIVPSLGQIARPERQVLGWFEPRRPEWFAPDKLPVFNLMVDEGHFYGLPAFDRPGFKVGKYHHFEEQIDPDDADLQGYPRDERVLRDFVERYFPQAAGPTLAMQRCIFTNTPDEHFILDFHPESPRVLIASPCSGHGFKFCSVVGEIMSDLVQNGTTRHDISMFRLKRFLA